MKNRTSEPLAGQWDQSLFDTFADPLFVIDVTHREGIRIVAANAASEGLFGIPAVQCINRPLAQIMPAPIALRFSAECDRCIETRRPIEFRVELHAADAHVAFGIKLSTPPQCDAIRYLSAQARAASTHCSVDVDPSTEHYRTIAEHASDYISRCGRDGRILYMNPAIERLTGPALTPPLGKPVSEWNPNLPHLKQYLECIRRVIETGKPQTVEMDFHSPVSGQWMCHQIRYAPEWSADGEVRSIIGIGRDITSLRTAEAELRSLNAKLEERVAARTLDLQRANADLRSFAMTVSHDVRAPLRAIRGYLALLAEDEGERLSAGGRAMLARVTAAASRLDALTDAILGYSQAGMGTLSRSPIAMEELTRELMEELLPSPSNVRVIIAHLPIAHADVTMVRQILQNLIGNALKFSASRNPPQIEVGWVEQAGQVVYYVRDNGAGFEMQYAEKLYSMFERLHNQGEFPGHGVGLAIVKRLIDRHGGRIWAESGTGSGATFYFTLGARP